MQKKKRYQKPKISKKYVKINQFFDPRIFDSFGDVFTGKVYATSHGVGSGTSSAGSAGSNACFVAGTKITLANGLKKEVQHLEIGDRLLSYNVITGKLSSSTVTQLEHHERTDGYLNINNLLNVTNDHPLWANDREWRLAGKLLIGNILLLANEKQMKIRKIAEVKGKIMVYNLQVDGDNTYFAENILAHNYSPFYLNSQPTKNNIFTFSYSPTP